MVYDAKVERIGKKLFKNIKLIAISEFVANELKNGNVPVTVIYDGFKCQKTETKISSVNPILFNVGIIGRISEAKGIMLLPQIFEYLQDQNEIDHFIFQLFGEQMLKENDVFLNFCKTRKSHVSLNGFQSTTKIYESVEIVLHLSHEEGLGRIFLEAICHKKPFIGFNTSGLEEIASLTSLDVLMVAYHHNEKQNIIAIAQKLIDCKNNFQSYSNEIEPEKILSPFNLSSYSQKIDHLLE
jgi:glycosyltransferase involved in cell wall biosynthesis